MNSRGVSVIICCYNSATRIAETLKYVSELAIPADCPAEVIVINNNSTDDTAAEAQKAARRYAKVLLPFRIIDEPRSGLAFAKMRGVKESRYDSLIFCDDDNHLKADYLVVAREILDRHSDVVIVGGWAKPKFAGSTNPWLEDFYPAMAIGPQAKEDGFVSSVYGAGMVLRTALFDSIREKGFVLQLSGRTGQNTNSGEDAELCLIAGFLGYKIYYTSRLSLLHAIAPHRLKKKHYLGARFEDIYPSIYLFLLHAWTTACRSTRRQLYREHMMETIRNIIYFTPRILLGKHRFYSLFMLYRNFQTLTWLIVNRKRFKDAYCDVIRNLSQSAADYKLQVTSH